MNMARFVVQRMAAAIPVSVIVSLIVFSLLYVAPGDPASIIAGDQASLDDIERIRETLGLNKPFVLRYLDWLHHVCMGDLGSSIFTNLPVTVMIQQRLEPTVSLMILTIFLSVTIAIPLGIVAAWKKNTWVDLFVMGLAVTGFSTPVFVLGYLLAYLFALQLNLLPVQGFSPISHGFFTFIRSLILPAGALSFVYAALIARITRASMIDVLEQDYIRTAKAKGVGYRTLLFLHGLKNAAIPIATVIGIGFATLIGGAVVTESVFAIPGLGRLTIDAILRRDYPIIQGVVLLFSMLYVFINLCVDTLYIVFDPRVRI